MARSETALATEKLNLTQHELALSAASRQVETWNSESSEFIEAATELFDERKNQSDLSETIRHTEASAKGFETRANNDLQKLMLEASTYNTKFQFAAVSSIDDERYLFEFQKLSATELPTYKKQIEVESQKAEHELREHIVHRLREQIGSAKRQLDRINEALVGLAFRGEKYKFKWAASDDLSEFYQLLMKARGLGASSLAESEFYQKNQSSFERFYELLTRVPQSELRP